MEAFGSYCSELKVIILARCTSLDGKAIAGIAKCEKLEKLDLSGCNSLTGPHDDFTRKLSHLKPNFTLRSSALTDMRF